MKSKKESIIFSTIYVTVIAVISKLVGFVREALIAAYYGANSTTDAFFFAQSMPSMIFPAVCSSLATAFTSIYITKSIQEGDKKSNEFAARAITSTTFIAIILGGLAFLLTPYIVSLFAPGFEIETQILTIRLTRLIMSSFVLIMLINMISAILNSKKKFFITQISGLVNSIFIIIVTLILGSGKNIDLLTLTVVGGSALQVLFLFIFIKKNSAIAFYANPFSTDIKYMIKLALPILLGNNVVQVQNIVNRALASTLQQGTVSALSYSGSINSIVVTVIILSLSTVLYPTLTENVADGKLMEYAKNLKKSLGLLIIITIPISIVVLFFSSDIISLVYERGSFDSTATYLTSSALKFYSVSYVFIAIREVLIRSFYALNDTKTPMKNFAIGVGFNVIFSLLLTPYMGISGIAFGASVSSFISAILLTYNIKKRLLRENINLYMPSVYKLGISSFLTSVCIFGFKNIINIHSSFISLLIGTILTFVIYLCLLLLFRCEELLEGLRYLTKYKRQP